MARILHRTHERTSCLPPEKLRTGGIKPRPAARFGRHKAIAAEDLARRLVRLRRGYRRHLRHRLRRQSCPPASHNLPPAESSDGLKKSRWTFSDRAELRHGRSGCGYLPCQFNLHLRRLQTGAPGRNGKTYRRNRLFGHRHRSRSREYVRPSGVFQRRTTLFLFFQRLYPAISTIQLLADFQPARGTGW